MRKQLIEQAAFDVANQVRAVEDRIDEALTDIAELQAGMVRVRTTAGIGVATGHAAFEHLAAALHGLVAARGGMAHCHAELKEAKSVIPGLRTTSFGEGDECPPAAGRANLRVVA